MESVRITGPEEIWQEKVISPGQQSRIRKNVAR